MLFYSGEALGAIGSKDALNLLEEYTKDPSVEVRVFRFGTKFCWTGLFSTQTVGLPIEVLLHRPENEANIA